MAACFRYLVNDVKARDRFLHPAFRLQARDASGAAFRRNLARRHASLSDAAVGSGRRRRRADAVGRAANAGRLEPHSSYRRRSRRDDRPAQNAGARFRNEVVQGTGGKQILVEDPVGQSRRAVPAEHGRLSRAGFGRRLLGRQKALVACMPTALEAGARSAYRALAASDPCAALDELGEIGYGGFTIKSVAARAGVGKSTIYRHWPDKLALIAEAFRQLQEERDPELVTGTPREKLVRILRHVAEILVDSPFSRLPAGDDRCRGARSGAARVSSSLSGRSAQADGGADRLGHRQRRFPARIAIPSSSRRRCSARSSSAA